MFLLRTAGYSSSRGGLRLKLGSRVREGCRQLRICTGFMAASCFLLGSLFGSLREEHGWAPQVLDFTLPGSEVHGMSLRNSCVASAAPRNFLGILVLQLDCRSGRRALLSGCGAAWY